MPFISFDGCWGPTDNPGFLGSTEVVQVKFDIKTTDRSNGRRMRGVFRVSFVKAFDAFSGILLNMRGTSKTFKNISIRMADAPNWGDDLNRVETGYMAFDVAVKEWSPRIAGSAAAEFITLEAPVYTQLFVPRGVERQAGESAH